MATPAAKAGLKSDTGIEQSIAVPDSRCIIRGIVSDHAEPLDGNNFTSPLTPRNAGVMPPTNIGIDRWPPGRMRNFGLAALGPRALFCLFRYGNLICFAAGSELYSYILLIPFISFYLVWVKRQNLPPVFPPARGTAAGFLTAGTMVLLAYWLVSPSPLETDGGRLSGSDDDLLPAVFFGCLRLVFGEAIFARQRFSIGLPDFHGADPGGCRARD